VFFKSPITFPSKRFCAQKRLPRTASEAKSLCEWLLLNRSFASLMTKLAKVLITQYLKKKQVSKQTTSLNDLQSVKNPKTVVHQFIINFEFNSVKKYKREHCKTFYQNQKTRDYRETE